MRCEGSSARRVSKDVEDFAYGTVGIQVGDCSGSGAAFVQEDERDVIRLWIFVSNEDDVLGLGLHLWSIRKKGERGVGKKGEKD